MFHSSLSEHWVDSPKTGASPRENTKKFIIRVRKKASIFERLLEKERAVNHRQYASGGQPETLHGKLTPYRAPPGPKFDSVVLEPKRCKGASTMLTCSNRRK